MRNERANRIEAHCADNGKRPGLTADRNAVVLPACIVPAPRLPALWGMKSSSLPPLAWTDRGTRLGHAVASVPSLRLWTWRTAEMHARAVQKDLERTVYWPPAERIPRSRRCEQDACQAAVSDTLSAGGHPVQMRPRVLTNYSYTTNALGLQLCKVSLTPHPCPCRLRHLSRATSP